LLLLTDAARLFDPEAAIRRLPKGSGVILRDYRHPERAILAARLARLCRQRHLLFLVAEDAHLARKVKADGLHLPERALRRPPLNLRAFSLVTAAAHGSQGLRRAAMIGADAALLSPVFATASHPGAPALGPLKFAVLAGKALLPLYALGGMTSEKARRLKNVRLAGIAGIGLFRP